MTQTAVDPIERSSLARLSAFHRDPLAFFQSLTRGEAARVRFRMGPWTFFLLNDPDSVHFVLSRHTRWFRKGPGLDADNPLIGAGLLTSEKEIWAEQRRRLGPVFRDDNIEKMVPWLDRAVEQSLAELSPGEPFDLEPAMLRLSLTLAMRTLFADDRAAGPEAAQMGADVRWLMAHFYHRSRSVWRFPYDIPGFNRRYHAHAARLRQSVHRLKPSPRPFDGVWAHLHQDDRLADQELLTLVIAGYETTGHAMAWALDLLSRHPDVLKLVEQESFQEMVPSPETHPWTDRVLKESLRLYPPVWLLGRVPSAPVEFEDLSLEPGNIVLMSPWLLHHTAEFFPEPEAFRPERWGESQAPAPYAYIPFGGGPRACIGEHLALTEARLALSRIVRSFRITTWGPRSVYPGLTLGAKDPLWAKVERR